MARMILLERIDQLYELFFGDWRNEYEEYRASRLGAGFLVDHRPMEPSYENEGVSESKEKVKKIL